MVQNNYTGLMITEIVKLLLEKGANVNTQNKDGDTGLIS